MPSSIQAQCIYNQALSFRMGEMRHSSLHYYFYYITTYLLFYVCVVCILIIYTLFIVINCAKLKIFTPT